MPRASVIISAFHSDATIADCLQSLRDQTFRDFEVIVVNSSPEERTRRIVEERFQEVQFEQATTRLLPHAARNQGVARARGDLLAFTDPDCRARADRLERLVGALDDGHPLVCGAIEIAGAGWFAQGVHLCKYSFRSIRLPGGPCWVAGTANAACTRELWTAVGPFDGDRFAGDALLSWRAAARGWKPWFDPRAVVEHRYIGSLASFWKERLARGEDFGGARSEFERWSRSRAAVHLAALPALPLLLLARTGRDALSGGSGLRFVATLPLQVAGQVAWLVGEARACRERIARS